MRIGVLKLKTYLEIEGIKSSRFADRAGVYPSTIHRILTGENSPDLKTALLIEEHTRAAVKVADWGEDAPIKKVPAKRSVVTSGSINRK